MNEYAVPFHWRRFKERYQMMGSKCQTCGTHFYPTRAICPNCRRKGVMSDVKLSGRGKVYSFTITRVPPDGFDAYIPYAIAIVELEEGCKVLSQVVDVDLDKIEIGMTVKSCFRKIKEENSSGIIMYGFKFKPA